MANKLKDTFSSKPFNLNIKLSFFNEKDSNAFGKALDMVSKEGKMVRVDGAASIETNIKHGNKLYPYDIHSDEITNIVVGPSKEEFELDLGICSNDEVKTIKLYRWYTEDKIIVETSDDSIVYFKMEFIKRTNKCNFTFKQQPTNAKNIQEIVNAYDIALLYLDKMFRNADQKCCNPDLLNEISKINDVKNAISTAKSLYNKFYEIEQEIGLSFDPNDITHNSDFYETVQEIYELIITKKIVRMNRTINDFQNKEMSLSKEEIDIEIGKKVLLTFINQMEYELLNEKVTIYTANALINAIVTEITMDNDKIQSVKYEGIESDPMFISFSGFKTMNEAENEQKNIVDKIKEYQNAKTVFEYVNEGSTSVSM
ncbi:MAG: putative abortive phage resistance protein AbiGii toxin [Bacillales bacterium]|jgi:hypothetical protein|nr:putative abortive phage resistance protein AbiGii toxin [Bacillales bacterium]